MIKFFIFSFNSSANLFKNYEFIQNVTFETRRINTATIQKSYPHFYILARASSANRRFYIYSMNISYYFCEKETIYGTHLPRVDSSTTNISKHVECPENAVSSDGKLTRNITVNCTPKGNWAFGNVTCVCDKGFYSNNEKCTCK
jgi:hypothetical protein